jgi:hypothetical protein
VVGTAHIVLGVDLSAVIFVVLAVAWAVYLIPKALKHHDEVARTRSIDRFSTAMRVLARREPVSRGDARLVLTPVRGAHNPRVLVPTERPARPTTGATPDASVAAPPPATGSEAAPAAPRRTVAPRERAAARAAARRRRRILSGLLLVTAVVTALAGFAVVPWWSVAIPGGLTLAYLALCRVQVRRLDARAALTPQPVADVRPTAPAAGEVPVVPPAVRPGVRVDSAYGSPVSLPSSVVVRNAQGFAEVEADDDTITIPAVVDVVAVPTADGGSLWDPLPVTLPTYVTKPKAKRTVRTIDLSEPGSWTSGRSQQDTALVAQADAEAAERAEGEDGQAETPRAVGS